MKANQEAPVGAEGFSISADRELDCVTITVAGEVDILAVAALRESLREPLIGGCRLLVIDLAGVTFMDSTGLGILVAAWKRARVLRIEMVVWRPSPPVATVMGLTALDRVLATDLRDAHPDAEHRTKMATCPAD